MTKPKIVLKSYSEINKERKRLRKIFLVISIPFVLAISLLSVKTTSMYVLAGETITHFNEKSYEQAQQKSNQQKSVNFLEEWLAYYNSGTSLLAGGKYPESITDFKKSASLLDNKFPQVCFVNANLALAYEQYGDKLAAQKNKIEAEKQYLLAVEVNSNSPLECSTPPGEGTGDSLKETAESSTKKAEEIAESSDKNEGDTAPSTPNESEEQENKDGREKIQEQLDNSNTERKRDEQTEGYPSQEGESGIGNNSGEPVSKPW